MSYEDVCANALKGYNASKETGKKGSNGPGVWHRGQGADEWTRGRRDDGSKKGGKKGSKGIKPDWYGDKDKRCAGNKDKDKAKARARAKPDTATTVESKDISSELPIQVDQQQRRRRGPRLVVGE